jgi:hypothetical protein
MQTLIFPRKSVEGLFLIGFMALGGIRSPAGIRRLKVRVFPAAPSPPAVYPRKIISPFFVFGNFSATFPLQDHPA